ncbi:MAG: multidrug MFS transporter [Lachnospiraceae bacterium]|nr:multidrug MFS transporter [Lachnospiraceae bacterium]
MIFVTVGTHEQQFDRLVEYMDKLALDEEINEEIIIQTGYSEYEPENCAFKKMYSATEMKELVKKARIVITHGGPSSFMSVLSEGKVPIVVPRMEKYKEHVNDHQLRFCKTVKERYNSIILVDDITKLKNIILLYDEHTKNLSNTTTNHNELFCKRFSEVVEGLFS